MVNIKRIKTDKSVFNYKKLKNIADKNSFSAQEQVKNQSFYFYSIDQSYQKYSKAYQDDFDENMGFYEDIEEDAEFIILNNAYINVNHVHVREEEYQHFQCDILNELVIGCKLVNGVVIKVKGQSVLLRGIEDMPRKNDKCSKYTVGLTRITKSLWSDFLKTHSSWSLLQDGTVFVVKNYEAGKIE